MTNALSGAVVLGPTRLRGVVPLKPCFELVGSHVDCIVEISIRRQRHVLEPDSTAGHSLDDIFFALNHGERCTSEGLV
jgi:hypothetical protein